MVKPQVALQPMDYVPDADELEEIAYHYLEKYPADEAHASIEVTYAAPDWLNTCEQDQLNAYMRDGSVCIVIVYMREGSSEED